jgi:hypothetical protein
MCHHEITRYDCRECGSSKDWRRARIVCEEAKGKDAYGCGQCSAAQSHAQVEVVINHVSALCDECQARAAKAKAERQIWEDYSGERGGT